jgi:hypothetical protein
MVDLASLLSKPASEVTPPKPLPNGVYVLTVQDYEYREAGEKKTPLLAFQIQATQPVDVDPSECELPKTLKLDMWLTEASLFRFKNFMEKDLQIEGGQRTMMEMLPETKGRMFRGEVIQKPYTPRGADEPVMINEIKTTFPLE